MSAAASPAPHRPPRVGAVLLDPLGQNPSPEALRQRACTELLRQRAIAVGLLDAADQAPADGVVSEVASEAIAALLEREVVVPEPDADECRRHHAARAARYRVGERVRLRHVLFAVTPGVDVAALRRRAEACLIEVRCETPGSDAFAAAAKSLSNCPSGADGGDLGWLGAEACAPEFASAVFGHSEVGVLPRLVPTRFGLHVVEVIARERGRDRPYAEVEGEVRSALRRQAYATALRQYLQVLAGEAAVEGVDLAAAATPLVQ